MHTKNAIIVNKDASEALSEDEQAALIAAGEAATARSREMSKATYAGQLGILAEIGTTFEAAPAEVMDLLLITGGIGSIYGGYATPTEAATRTCCMITAIILGVTLLALVPELVTFLPDLMLSR
ncbi:hypothetical protein [Pseudooceanicola sp. HF7]|uniref:hypothetical protein n=1 Tax=Pseudooceanicola sp. HF7 TaxID=2721560 RepID=UPI0014311204|nr:hypothetical protein [Pseudooceanicola sp. HF7]NIZ08374.1 hypothetical protein [Pseudooceanicola sp. HF7]